MRAAAGVLTLAAALVAAGCGDRGAEPAAAQGGTERDRAAEATTTSVAPLFSSDFEAVCAGAGQRRAAEYRPDAPGPHPVVVFQGTAGHLAERTGDLPDHWRVDWQPDHDALAEIELVACAVATPGAVVRECGGYEDEDGRPSGQVVHLRAATYEVTLREAATGDVVTATTIGATEGTCPLVVASDTTEELATDDLAVVRLLAPFVEG